MTTTQLEYWRVAHLHLAEDQHPGCHTHASGFDYIATSGPEGVEDDLHDRRYYITSRDRRFVLVGESYWRMVAGVVVEQELR